METDEEVVWNGAPAQQDLLMTESEDDSEVALLQMLASAAIWMMSSWIATASPRQTSKRFK